MPKKPSSVGEPVAILAPKRPLRATRVLTLDGWITAYVESPEDAARLHALSAHGQTFPPSAAFFLDPMIEGERGTAAEPVLRVIAHDGIDATAAKARLLRVLDAGQMHLGMKLSKVAGIERPVFAREEYIQTIENNVNNILRKSKHLSSFVGVKLTLVETVGGYRTESHNLALRIGYGREYDAYSTVPSPTFERVKELLSRLLRPEVMIQEQSDTELRTLDEWKS